MQTKIKIFFSLLFFFTSSLIAHANVGDLDNTFGDNGFSILDFNTNSDWLSGSIIDESGKLLVVGNKDTGILVARLNTDGSLDDSFGNNGVTIFDLGIDQGTSSRNITLDALGNILVVGDISSSKSTSWDDAIVIRFTPNGDLDTAFSNDGTTDGYTIVDYGSNDSLTSSINIDSSGKIIISGWTYEPAEDFAVARLNSDGTLDRTFSDDGYTTLDFGLDLEEHAYAMTIDDSDKIILVGHGYSNPDSYKDLAIARFNTDGTLDSTFNDVGYRTLDLGENMSERSYAVTINNAGKIVVAGPEADSDLAITRFNIDGSLDTSFNGVGYTIQKFNLGDSLDGIAIDSLGKIVMAMTTGGYTDHNFALARFNNDGTLDTTFTSDGFQTYTPTTNGQETFESLNIDQNGNYILVGSNETDGLIARVSGDLCGNNNLADGEECDDNNNINGDGCSEFCQKEVLWYPDSDGDGLGDADNAGTSSVEAPSTGYVTNNTDCDDTNKTLTTDCSITTVTQTCLNKEIEGTEECDDGKATETCSADCKKISLEKSSTPSTSSCSLTKTNTPSNILFEFVALQIILFGWMRKSVTQDKKNH